MYFLYNLDSKELVLKAMSEEIKKAFENTQIVDDLEFHPNLVDIPPIIMNSKSLKNKLF